MGGRGGSRERTLRERSLVLFSNPILKQLLKQLLEQLLEQLCMSQSGGSLHVEAARFPLSLQGVNYCSDDAIANMSHSSIMVLIDVIMSRLLGCYRAAVQMIRAFLLSFILLIVHDHLMEPRRSLTSTLPCRCFTTQPCAERFPRAASDLRKRRND